MKGNILIIALLICIMSSCKEEKVDNMLIGQWSWVQSSGGIAGVLVTPESTGDTKSLTITSDSLIFSTNGQRTAALKYQNLLKPSIYSEEPTRQLVTDAVDYTYELDAGNLYLSEECYDCFIHVYTMKNN